MSDVYAGILKKRALGFLENAKDNFKREQYDLVLFHVEQFLQLYLKYLLYKKIGVYPKTHSPIYLLKEVIKIHDNDELKGFYDKNLEMLNLLEDAYITSRYLPREYDKELAERVLEFTKKALEVLEWIERLS